MKNVTMAIVFMHCLCVGADTARIGAYVIDAVTQAPIPNIKVSASFGNDNGWKAWTESAPIYHDTQETDVNGFCTLKGKTNIGRAGCGVDKQGTKYYGAGGGGFHFTKKNLLGVWQPDNLVVTIRLQRVEHPIPLWVKNVGDRINRSKVGHWNGTNMVFRYDFVKGDYLPPDGNGEIADIVINSQITHLEMTNIYREAKTFFDFTNRLLFPGDGNGLIPVIADPKDGIKLRTAPLDGYEHAFALKCGTRKQPSGAAVFRKRYSESDPNRCHYFRIRSRFDGTGNLVEAYYGKIYGDFKIAGRLENGSSVEFLYYLNPTSLDRNLEWDMKTNLCPNPGSLGQLQP